MLDQVKDLGTQHEGRVSGNGAWDQDLDMEYLWRAYLPGEGALALQSPG